MEMIAEKSSFQRFIVFLDPEPSQWDIVKVPEQFVSENWHHIPFKVKVLLPNGLCFPVHYRKKIQSITHVANLFKECRKTSGSILVFGYRSYGTFLVSILGNQGSEVEYSIPVKDDSDIVSFQDKILGNGWNFISIANESLLYDGEIEIPTPYFKQFRKVIPPYVIYGLKNGELFKGRYSFGDKKLYDLMDLVIYANVEEGDVLMFKLCGYGEFDITLFNKSRLERIEEISVKTEPIDDTAVEDVTGIAVYDDPSDHQVDVIPKEFTVIMTKSNVDNTSHGVYIPNNITPENRQWTSNEDVTLRTRHGEWTVRIVISKGMGRFSKGWNKFTDGNKLKYKHTLVFNLVNDEENGSVFDVELH